MISVEDFGKCIKIIGNGLQLLEMDCKYWKWIAITRSGLKLWEIDMGIGGLPIGSGITGFPGLVLMFGYASCKFEYGHV